MQESINAEREKKIATASRNFEEIMRRIEPFIRRPKEEPKESPPWESPDSSTQVKSLHIKK